jgi:hypothetical protein
MMRDGCLEEKIMIAMRITNCSKMEVTDRRSGQLTCLKPDSEEYWPALKPEHVSGCSYAEASLSVPYGEDTLDIEIESNSQVAGWVVRDMLTGEELEVPTFLGLRRVVRKLERCKREPRHVFDSLRYQGRS